MDVDGMWKLCKAAGKSARAAGFSGGSEVGGSDFSHQEWAGKLVTTGGLKKISTSPQGLLLLLVLRVLHLI